MPICKIGCCKIAVVENKIVETSTRAWVSSAKKDLIRDLPGTVGKANDNANDSIAVPVDLINSTIDLVIDSEIVKVLTGTKIDDDKKILLAVLLDKVKNANNLAASQEPDR